MNCPRAMASSMRRFARASRPRKDVGIEPVWTPEPNLSFRVARSSSRSFLDMLLSFEVAYVLVRSLAFEIRCVGVRFGRMSGCNGLCASCSMRRTASPCPSVPVHGAAMAISFVPRPTAGDNSASVNAARLSDLNCWPAILSRSSAFSSSEKPAASMACCPARPPSRSASSVACARRRDMAPRLASWRGGRWDIDRRDAYCRRVQDGGM